MNDTNANVFVSLFCILVFCVPIFVCLCYCNINNKRIVEIKAVDETTSILTKV